MRDGSECATEERVESEPVVSPKNLSRVTDFLADGATGCDTIHLVDWVKAKGTELEVAMTRKLVAVAFVSAIVLLGIGGPARAQFNFGDPFTPYNSQYNQFTYPMMPNDNAFPGSGYLDGYGVPPRRSGSLDRFVDDLSNGSGLDGDSSIRPKRVPHGMIRSRPSQPATLSPEAQAAEKLQEARRKINDDYNKALNERDPKKRKQMFQQLERERLNYLREIDEASKSVERPLRPLARGTTSPTSPARPGAPSARRPGNAAAPSAARGGSSTGRNPAQPRTANSPRPTGTTAAPVPGRGSARPAPSAGSSARTNAPAGSSANGRAATNVAPGRTTVPPASAPSPFVNPSASSGSISTGSQSRDLMRAPGSVDLDDRTRDLLAPPPLLRRPGSDTTAPAGGVSSESDSAAASRSSAVPKASTGAAANPKGSSPKARDKEKDTPARILEESKSLKPE
jgi:hypothetical protein